MNKPMISIIIPIYNVEEYLDECLTSVYKLKGIQIEVILVNDGSTDKSLQIADSYSNAYPNITKLITRKNGGLSAARNTGLEHATGEWLAFLDSDDFIDPQAFEKVLARITKSEADILAISGYRFLQETGKTLPLHVKKNPFIDKGLIDSKIYLSKMLEIGITNIVTVWDKVYRRSALEKLDLRFIEGMLHEDVPFTFELLVNKNKIEYIPENVIFYRQRAGSIMTTHTKKKSLDKIKIANILLATLKKSNVNDPHINGYIVHLIKNNSLNGVASPKDLLFTMLVKKLTVKKRFVLIYSILLNGFFFLKKLNITGNGIK